MRTAKTRKKRGSEDPPLHRRAEIWPGERARRLQRNLLLGAGGLCGTAELREDFLFAEDQIFLVLDFDFRTAVLAEKNAVARLDVEGNEFALFALAGADCDDFALLGLLFRGVRDDDATLDGFLLLNALHDNAVVERSQIDCHLRKSSMNELAGLLVASGRLALLTAEC